MLELYRECPRCRVHAKVDAEKCESCGQALGKSLGASTNRKVLFAKVGAGVFVFGLLFTGLARPDWARDVTHGRLPDAFRFKHEEVRQVWTLTDQEPPARLWAWKLDKSLADGCTEMHAQAKKLIEPTLNFQLMGGTLELSKQTVLDAKKNHTPIPRLTANEANAARASFGTQENFLATCMTKAYKAIEPCEQFKADLMGDQSRNCFLPPVQKMIGLLPYQLCAQNDNVEFPRIKTLCTALVERMQTPNPSAAPVTGM